MNPALLRWLHHGRRVALVLLLLAGIGWFGHVVDEHYPITEWLFWRYAGYWLCCAVLSLAFVSLGNAIVTRVLRHRLPLLEHLIVSFALGMFGFELLMFLCGMLQLYDGWLFVLLPLFAIVVGLPQLISYTRQALGEWRSRRHLSPKLPGWCYALMAFGLLVLVLIYIPIITPHNVQYDSLWKHLALAEDFVVHGGVRRFDEGLTFATRPHFTSFLYAWALLLPGGRLFDHILLAAHIEFTVFLWTTLVGIPALVRRLVPDADARLVWVARLLFPGILVYDSTLSVGADHVGALFSVPAFILVHRTLRDFRPRVAILLGMTLAGAALVKYTIAALIIPGAVLFVAIWTVVFIYRIARHQIPPGRRRNAYLVPLAATVSAVILSAPFWLHNLLWYGSPMYPFLHQYFTPRPWTPDAAYMVKYGYQEFLAWSPEHNLEGLWETIKQLFWFSFDPHDWGAFHGKVPVFGSLMTLTVVCLPLLRRTRQVWFLVLWTHLAIFTWFWLHHQDRYLQGIMPWMAAVTAAMIVLLWRTRHGPVRAALCGLIGIQIVWGGDAFFMPSHTLIKSPPRKVLDLLSAGYGKKHEQRLAVFPEWAKLGQQMPKGGRVLLHDVQPHLGVGVTSVSDYPTWQYGISYGLLESPRAVYELYRKLGVTHIFWSKYSRGWDSLAGDLVFYDFALCYTVDRDDIGLGTLARLPDEPPSDEAYDLALILGCGDGRRAYETGLYRVADLRVPSFGPKRFDFPAPRRRAASPEAAATLANWAWYVVVNPKCAGQFGSRWRAHFTMAAKRKHPPRGEDRLYEFWIRKSCTSMP